MLKASLFYIKSPKSTAVATSISVALSTDTTLGSKQDHTKIPVHSQVYAKTELINGMRQVTTSECPYSLDYQERCARVLPI